MAMDRAIEVGAAIRYKGKDGRDTRNRSCDRFFVPMRVAVDDAGGFELEFHLDAHGCTPGAVLMLARPGWPPPSLHASYYLR